MSDKTPHHKRLSHLGDLPTQDFLNRYWQKEPILIRQALPSFSSLISPDELAGLSLEDDVVSRLVIEHLDTNQWEVTHGPFSESKFTELPKSHWSLLVQHVDSIDPRFNALLQQFRFIPNWRLDDIMVSFASPGGGVGPHFDYFDVFLIQAAGKRRWRIGQHCDQDSELIPNQPMKLLKKFDTKHDWVVEPGDLIYIPAGTAHWGEAINECMTYSVGFRAPSHADTLLDLSQEVASQLSEDQRYCDPNLIEQTHSGAITEDTIGSFQQTIQHHFSDPKIIAQWFGEYSTRLKQDISAMLEPCSIEELNSTRIKLSTYCRAAFYSNESYTMCFINGDSYECSVGLAQTLSDHTPFSFKLFKENDQKILIELFNQELLELAPQ